MAPDGNGELSGQRIVITGGAGGIGVATARALLAQGAHVHLVDVRDHALEEAAGDLDGLGSVSIHTSAIETPAACAAALDDAGGAVYGLVHLAGLFEPDPLDADEHAVWERAMAHNLTNAYDMALAFRDHMDVSQVGRLVLTTSVAATRGSPFHVSYSAAKAGLLGLVRSLSQRWAPTILVNGVAPGVIETPMTERIIAERGKAMMHDIPLGRFGRADEVAGVIAFLCTSASSYVTGQIVQVDGGMVRR